jgi:coenzyme PQQ precursor peptide PqqA
VQRISRPQFSQSPLANFYAWLSLIPLRRSCRGRREIEMAWKAPKIVEVPVGMEINMYACAVRK